MQYLNGQTISTREKQDKKDYLEQEIIKNTITIKYLQYMKEYFIKNNITIYKKFDKRDFDKIKDFLQTKKIYGHSFLYYNYTGDNIGLYQTNGVLNNKKEITFYINNDDIYNAKIEISNKNIYNDTITFNNVLEIVENALLYNKEKLKQNKNLYKNYDDIINKYNKKVKELSKIIYNNHLTNIFDLYLYVGQEYEEK